MEKVRDAVKQATIDRDDGHGSSPAVRSGGVGGRWWEHAVPRQPGLTSRHLPVSFGRDVMQRANAALDDANLIVSTILRTTRRIGRINYRALNRCAELLTDSFCEGPNALLWALRIRRNKGHLYRRAVGCAVFALALGRQLGYEKKTLMELAVGGLLLDIGKIAVPVPILAKPAALNSTERSMVKRHVEYGIDLARSDGDVPDKILDMVLGHHERLDGSGYPNRLAGTEIPLFARMAGIVDTFDALTVDRPYAQGVSPHEALRTLNSERGTKFDATLVDTFINAIGVYPTGTWVRLSDGYVGVVCVQNPHEPLSPRIAVVIDDAGEPLTSVKWIEPSDIGEISAALLPASHPHYARMLERTLQLGVYAG